MNSIDHRLVILTDNQCGPTDSDTHCGGCVEEHRSQHCSGVDPSGNLGLVLGLESGLGVGVVLVLRLGSRLRLGVSVSDTAMSRQTVSNTLWTLEVCTARCHSGKIKPAWPVYSWAWPLSAGWRRARPARPSSFSAYLDVSSWTKISFRISQFHILYHRSSLL